MVGVLVLLFLSLLLACAWRRGGGDWEERVDTSVGRPPASLVFRSGSERGGAGGGVEGVCTLLPDLPPLKERT